MGDFSARARRFVAAIGLLALTFPPASDYLFADQTQAWAARLAATDIGIAVCGPLLATYLEPTVAVRGSRRTNRNVHASEC